MRERWREPGYEVLMLYSHEMRRIESWTILPEDVTSKSSPYS